MARPMIFLVTVLVSLCSPTRGDEVGGAARAATLVVMLRSDAVLELENVQMDSSGSVRRFNIPSLDPGKEYPYRVKASWADGTRTRTAERTVRVRAGATVEVDLRPDDAGADERAVLDLTNAERRKMGLAPLALSAELCRAARAHSKTMADRNQLAHTFGQEQFTDRIAATGYRAGEAGENIAMGAPTPSEAVAMWMRSPGHRANILNPRFRELGIGIGTSAGGQKYYTQVFAAPAAR